MGERFEIIIDSVHLPDAGISNPNNVPPESVVMVNIASAEVPKVRPENEPITFKSEKTGRGPLQGDWMSTTQPIMTCYKKVSTRFQVFGLQSKVENFFQNWAYEGMTKLHKEIFCAMDRWHGLSMTDVRKIEDEIKEELAKKMAMQEGLSEASTPIESVKSTPF